jgi:hypothetical protein
MSEDIEAVGATPRVAVQAAIRRPGDSRPYPVAADLYQEDNYARTDP